ncbi:MAG: hypothetical protein AB1578_20070 [Thermodesulfobacteriota bacterium]
MNGFARAKQRQRYRENPAWQSCARCLHRRQDPSRGEWDSPPSRCGVGGFVVLLRATCRSWKSQAGERGGAVA